MENFIKNLKISNFKSIREAELECGRINLFVGRPNVGKSNVLEALGLFCAPYSNKEKFLGEFIRYEKFSNLFFDQETDKNIVVQSNIGTAAIIFDYPNNVYDLLIGNFDAINLKLENGVDFEQFIKAKENEGNPLSPSYAIIQQDGKVDGKILARYSPVKKYIFNGVKEIGYRQMGFLLPPYGKNLIPILLSNRSLREEIEVFFEEYQLKLILDEQNGTIEMLKELGKQLYKKFPYLLIADTVQRVIFHYAAIFSNKDSVILLEEPESHSYPPYIQELAMKIIESKNNQFFITTHSPYLFNKIVENTPSDELAVFVSSMEDYETKFEKLSDTELSELMNYGVDIFFNLNHFVHE